MSAATRSHVAAGLLLVEARALGEAADAADRYAARLAGRELRTWIGRDVLMAAGLPAGEAVEVARAHAVAAVADAVAVLRHVGDERFRAAVPVLGALGRAGRPWFVDFDEVAR